MIDIPYEFILDAAKRILQTDRIKGELHQIICPTGTDYLYLNDLFFVLSVKMIQSDEAYSNFNITLNGQRVFNAFEDTSTFTLGSRTVTYEVLSFADFIAIYSSLSSDYSPSVLAYRFQKY